jgi:bla regulator protein blaR1
VNSASVLAAVAGHLWQSTLFAGAAGGLTLLAHRNSARVRYCLWLAASVKFLVPFAVLTAVGALIPWRLAPMSPLSPMGHLSGHAPYVLLMAGAWPEPVVPLAAGVAPVAHGSDWSALLLPALGALWLLGVLIVAGLVLQRWVRTRHALRASEPAPVDFVIPVRSCATHLEPAVVGIIRPVLLLPKDIELRLTPEQLQAVLAHERCHVVWRDNLAAVLHMLAAALFWFHPLIWWLGRRFVEERERACDEQVLSGGHQPESYAEGILAVCEHHIQSRLSCTAGAGGADLRKRIEAIMNNRMIERLSGVQKAVLAAAAAAAIAVPIGAGLLGSPRAQAQAAAPGSSAPTVRERAKLGARFPQNKDFYPVTARRLGESGTVVVHACVGPNGRLTEAPTIATSSGSPRLDHGALRLAEAGDGKYEPATENRQPVESCFEFPVTFALIRESAPESHAAAPGIQIAAPPLP